MPTENVAATGLASGSCCLDAADHITNIDKVIRTRRGQQPLATANLEEHATTGGLPVPGADHVHRIDDDGIQPLIDLRQHSRLCLPLGDNIGAFHHTAWWGLFISRQTIGSEAEGIDT